MKNSGEITHQLEVQFSNMNISSAGCTLTLNSFHKLTIDFHINYLLKFLYPTCYVLFLKLFIFIYLFL
jgi:hypothetical protein